MRRLTTTGKTVEDALNLALDKLQVKRDQIRFTVLAEPSRGFLGLFGKKEAEVEVEILATPIEETHRFLDEMIRKMGLSDFVIQVEEIDSHTYKYLIQGEQLGILIGKRGQTLEAIQYLLNLVVNKRSHHFIKIILDIENYRERRKEYLEKLAFRLAQKVIHSKTEIMMEPLSSHERKIVHSYLQTHPMVSTASVGDEPNRKIVIRPRRR